MGISGAELHIVADHQQRHAPGQQRAEDLRKHLLEFRVQTLGGLVQQQDLRLQQQHLGQRRTLLLAAGQIVGMAVQQRFQTAQAHHPGHPCLLLTPGQLAAGEDLKQILPDGLFHKQGLGILRQHPQRTGNHHIAPIGLFQSRQQLQRRGFAGAVAAQQRQKLAAAQRQVKPFHHVGTVLLIAEPGAGYGDHRLTFGVHRLRRQGLQGLPRGKVLQKVPTLPHGDGAGRVRRHRRPDPHGGGHGQKHPVSHGLQMAAGLCRRTGTQQPPLVHHRHNGGKGEGLLQPVLRQQNGGAQLPVDLAQHRQKVRRGDGVQLAGRLVQDQHVRLHGHDGGQIQQLLLPAGKLGHILVKPLLNTEKRRHLRHTAANGGGILSQTFQPEGQLVPHLIGDDLVLRGLLHKADAGSLGARIHLLQRRAAKQDAAGAHTVRRQRRL